MKYKCGLCEISPSCSDPPTGDREEIVAHIEAHSVLDVDLYLAKAGEQSGLGDYE